MGAAGCHGMLCGMLCADAQLPVQNWLRAVLSEQPQAGADSVTLGARELGVVQSLHEQTRASLAAADMHFALLLPDDDEPIGVRVEALTSWCEGFLHGFGLAVQAGRSLPENVAEAIKDITEIGRADVANDAHSEINEGAYTEVVEYLRVAALLIYEELNPVRERNAPAERGGFE